MAAAGPGNSPTIGPRRQSPSPWARCMPIANHLHLWSDRFLYVTPSIQSGLTARSAVTLLASATGQAFTLVAHDGTVLRCTAALVAPHVPRRLDADGCGLLSLNVEPGSALFSDLMRFLGSAPIVPFDARVFGALREAFEGALHDQLDRASLHALCASMVLVTCGTRRARPTPLDARVARVLHVLREEAGQGQVPLRNLATQVCLSPDRLTHLFREQTGLSIKRYLLWAKIRRTVPRIAAGLPLTDSALAGGFTDAAHMSRTFQRYFGLPPSFLANAGCVAMRVDAHVPRSLAD